MPIMPFGEYKGCELDNLDVDYLLDLEEQDDPGLKQHPEVQAYIDANREALLSLSIGDGKKS